MKNYAFLRFPGFKNKAVTLSYDDGTVFDKKLISILDKYGLKCTFNLNSSNLLTGDDKRLLSEKSAISLYKNSPHEVAIHGYEHKDLTSVPSDVALFDIIEDRKNLEKIFGRVINGMAYAYGTFNDEVVDILKKCKIKFSRTTIGTHGFDIPSDWLRLPATCHHADPELMNLVDKFLDEKPKYFMVDKPKLFYLWGHSYEFGDSGDWSAIENFAKKIGNRDDVWYCTNGEICDYVKAFDNLEFSVDGTIVKNSSNLDIYLRYYEKNILVKANSEMKII